MAKAPSHTPADGPNSQQQLAALFRETGSVHHRTFAATSGEDPDWPAWYAEYLVPRLHDLLGRSFDPLTVARDLKAMDADHSAAGGQEAWPEFYARAFRSRHSLP